MPTYLFRCDQCDFTMEKTFLLAAAIIEPACLSCDRLMRRIYSAPGVSFKGTGWGKDK